MKWIRWMLVFGICVFLNVNAQPLGILPAEFKPFDLEQLRPASVALSKKSPEHLQLLLSPNRTYLEVQLGKTRQTFKINRQLLQVLPHITLVVARDFNFDGLSDFAITQDFNASTYFDDIYVFDSTSHRFKPMPAPDQVTRGVWCNPELDFKLELILTDCPHGRSRDYGFWKHKPFLYRSSEVFELDGFALKDSGVALMKIFSPFGILKRYFFSEFYRTNQAIMRRIPIARVNLYRAPQELSRTSNYIVQNDLVQILEVRENQGVQWLRIKYHSQKRGWIGRWIHL